MHVSSPPTILPRMNAMTDDLSHDQCVGLLCHLYEHMPRAGFFALVKQWRKMNDLPVDKAD